MTLRNLRVVPFFLVAFALLSLGAMSAFAQDSAPAAPLGGTVPSGPSTTFLPISLNGAPLQPALVTSVRAGADFACALSAVGEVYCWGWHTVDPWINAQAQFDIVPVKVAGLANVQQISAGMVHACALLADKTVACWGDNIYGQLGFGNGAPSATPGIVPNLSNVVQVEAGTRGTCVLLENGSVECWGTLILFDGENFVGHIYTEPTPVPGLEAGVATISLGGTHMCVLMESGAVRCWGNNSRGELGDGTTNDSLAPVDVDGLPDDIASISAGVQRTCAVTGAGAVLCWGSNEFDNLGDGSDVDYSTTPVAVVGLSSGVASVDADYYRSCAVKEDGTVWCWGVAPLGDGDSESSPIPVQVSDLANADQVSSGFYFSCAITATQAARCWGENYYGQLGDGTVVDALSPTWVAGMDNR